MPQQTTSASILANAACHPTIACTDINRARQFYVKTLGLTATQESGEHGISLRAGDGTTLYVYPRANHTPPGNTVCSFSVSDVPAAVAALRGQGVKFEEYDMPGLKTKNGIAQLGDNQYSAWFKDPDGNILAIGNVN